MSQNPSAGMDPLTMWRDWVTQSENQWNAFFNQAMATDEFSQTMGRFMDVYVNMQKTMNDVMGRYLTAANLPTRTDILALGDRLAAIEERLIGLEANGARAAAAGGKATAAAGAKPTAAAAPGKRPARTRKPPAKA